MVNSTAGDSVGRRHWSAREKLYAFLQERPGGADSAELAGLLLSGVGSDPQAIARFVGHLLGGDPNFVRDPVSSFWKLAIHQTLQVSLEEASFVVVDLETIGGSPGPGTIIEIGAYRMRGRGVGESFQSLVRPRSPIPRFIARLTSISNEMVAAAPTSEEVMPAFRDFLGDAVLVAHNAQFDHSFLDFEFRRLFGIGICNPVLCTLRLARRMLPSLGRKRLDALAEHFGLSTQGRHRGLGDARMAAELLSIFIEGAQRLGITRLDRLLDWQQRNASCKRIERHVPPEVIAAIPPEPGVYLMRNERGDILYVGKARRLRERVASYFNGGLSRNAKVIELVSHVHQLETRVTDSSLEAALLESRLIRELKPPYNRLLKSAPAAYFIKLDQRNEFARLTFGTKLSRGGAVLQFGPFIGRRRVAKAVRALSRMLGLRTCTKRLLPDPAFSPCIYGQMGHCSSPCNQKIDADAYAANVRRAADFVNGHAGGILRAIAAARDDAARALRFEEAGRHQRDLDSLRLLAIRSGRLARIVIENNLVIVTRPAAATDARRFATVRVVLSGRLAFEQSMQAGGALEDSICEAARFVRDNYERYRAAPIARDELDAMMIVARWLREREPDEGGLIYLDGKALPIDALRAALGFDGEAAAGGETRSTGYAVALSGPADSEFRLGAAYLTAEGSGSSSWLASSPVIPPILER
ncbi:MAG TPA: exonuclease domain-containing protein [Candidatus Binataceae bacterium]